jgi:hypothetical protein
MNEGGGVVKDGRLDCCSVLRFLSGTVAFLFPFFWLQIGGRKEFLVMCDAFSSSVYFVRHATPLPETTTAWITGEYISLTTTELEERGRRGESVLSRSWELFDNKENNIPHVSILA